MNELTADEQLALIWLHDENEVVRSIRKEPDGSSKVINEIDRSGGLHALIRLLLDMSKPLHQDIREALANAVDPQGDSGLLFKKRSRRGRGRPPHDTIEHDLRRTWDVLTIPEAVEAETRKSKIPAVGTKLKKTTRKEAIECVGAKEGKKRTEIYETLRLAKQLK